MEHNIIFHQDSDRTRPSPCLQPPDAVFRIALVGIGVCIALMASRVNGADTPSPMAQAFRSGTGNAIDVTLETEEKNGTTVMRAAGLTRECYLCTHQMRLASARDFGVAVFAHLQSTEAAKLQLSGFADTRTTWIDGIAVPGHLLELQVIPGPHLVTVHQNGETGILKLNLTADGRQTLSPTDFQFPHFRSGLRNAGILLAALGVIAAASGGVLLYYDGGCAASVRADGECSPTHDTLAPGIVFSSLGAAMVGAGITILIKRSRLKKEAKRQFTGGLAK
jgi:hypothetical protein